MSNPTTEQLTRLVNISSDPHDLDARVAHQFGAEHRAAARLVAVQVNGARWVFGEGSFQTLASTAVAWRVLRRPTSLVLALTSIFVLLACLYPPFSLNVQGELVVHTGFFSLFGEPSTGMRRGAVNVPLLAVECLVLVCVGAAMYLLAQRFEHAPKA
jgi:hypothetical protein